MGKKRSFDLAFKLRAVTYANEHSGEEAARHFGVDPKRIREWRKQITDIEKKVAEKGAGSSKRMPGGGAKKVTYKRGTDKRRTTMQADFSSSDIIQFKNCYVLRNHQLIKDDLWIRNKKIVNPEPIFFDEKVTADIQVDCKGAIISPGFIDLQINGGFGLDFSNVADVDKALEKVAKGILANGVTSFCPTVITSSPNVYREVLPKIVKKDGSSQGAGILGAHVEGPFISREKKGAHPVQHIRRFETGIDDLLDVYGSLDNVRMITLAPELENSSEVIEHLVSQGITVSVGHSSGNLSDGEAAVKMGATFITHLFNAMLPFHHRDPGLVGLLTSQYLPPQKTVYYGIIADGIHTHPAALRIAYRAHPKGLVLVTDAMSALGLEAGTHFIGEQAVEIKGHKAVLAGTNVLCGSIAPMDICINHFRKSTGCSIVEALECASLHPAQALGITNSKGTLEFETDADFVMLDDALNVKATFIAGELVWQSDEFEKCDIKRLH